MKRILGIIALSGLLTAAPSAFAEVDVFFNFGLPAPAPVYVTPAPQAVYYRHGEPRWHERRDYFERRHEFREHHDGRFRHDYRDRY